MHVKGPCRQGSLRGTDSDDPFSEAARAWVYRFASWYNTEHRHSERYPIVTPDERHGGRDREILANHEIVYAIAKAKHTDVL